MEVGGPYGVRQAEQTGSVTSRALKVRVRILVFILRKMKVYKDLERRYGI